MNSTQKIEDDSKRMIVSLNSSWRPLFKDIRSKIPYLKSNSDVVNEAIKEFWKSFQKKGDDGDEKNNIEWIYAARDRFKERKAKFVEKRDAVKNRRADLADLRSKNEEERLTIMKEHMSNAADMLINVLERIKNKAESSTSLSEEDAASIISSVDSKIATLNEQKEDMNAATTKDELKDASKAFRENFVALKKEIRDHIKDIKDKQRAAEGGEEWNRIFLLF